MALNISRLFSRKQAFSRSAVRYACKVDCELVLTDSMVSYEGRLIDVSAGGVMFRPRLCYLMYRRDVPVQLVLDGERHLGVITGTNHLGFGVRFDRTLTDAELSRILARSHDGEALAA